MNRHPLQQPLRHEDQGKSAEPRSAQCFVRRYPKAVDGLKVVVPRFLALALMTALYNIPMIIFTCLSGYLASVALVGVNSGAFISTFFTQGTLQDLYGGELKCVIFGAVIATVCCYKGITAKGGAEGVARAVHQSVVACFVSIQILEYLYTPTILALFHSNNVLR